jgi:nicotinamide riboside transporter PnuC
MGVLGGKGQAHAMASVQMLSIWFIVGVDLSILHLIGMMMGLLAAKACN